MRHSTGFTMIELLVVMVIIALLVGLLMPALASTKDYARTIQCMSNLRQLGMAMMMYKNDNGGYFCPAVVDGYYGGENRLRWHGERKDTAYNPAHPEDFIFQPRNGMLYGYLARRQAELLRCPRFSQFRQAGEIEWSDWMGNTDSAFESGSGAYGYNDTYVGGTHYVTGYDAASFQSPTRETEMGDPMRTIMFADTALAVQAGGRQHLIEYSFAQPPFFVGETVWGSGRYEPQPSWGLATPSMHFRHSGGQRCNVLWCDGHVSSVLWGFTNPINIYGGNCLEYRIGFPGEPPGNDLFEVY